MSSPSNLSASVPVSAEGLFKALHTLLELCSLLIYAQTSQSFPLGHLHHSFQLVSKDVRIKPKSAFNILAQYSKECGRN